MPRRREVPKRETLPDPAFGSTLITKFINCMMIQGKKSVAEGAFYGGLELVKDRAKEDPVKVFKKALENVKPILEVKSRRVGGATYQVPIEVPQDRRTSLAIRWILQAVRGGKGSATSQRLAAEVMAARLPRARHVVIPDAGHVTTLEQPDAVNQALLDFLRAPAVKKGAGLDSSTFPRRPPAG